MEYKKPDKPMEEWSDEELKAYENHLTKQQQLRRIKELEEAEKKTPKPDEKTEDSTDDKPVVDQNKKLEDDAYKIFTEKTSTKK